MTSGQVVTTEKASITQGRPNKWDGGRRQAGEQYHGDKYMMPGWDHPFLVQHDSILSGRTFAPGMESAKLVTAKHADAGADHRRD